MNNCSDYSLEELEDFKSKLQALLAGDIRSEFTGICRNMYKLEPNDGRYAQMHYLSFVCNTAKTWPEHSGCYDFPVIDRVYTGKWDNPARIRLVRFLLDKVNSAIGHKLHPKSIGSCLRGFMSKVYFGISSLLKFNKR